MIVTEQTIANWRANYGLDTRTPPDAVRLWEATGAPAGAVAALGWALLEIERLQAGLEAQQQRHFEIHAGLIGQLQPMRDALEAVVAHTVPGLPPGFLANAGDPWPQVAAVLWPEGKQ